MAAFPRVSMGRPYLEKYAGTVWETDPKLLERWQKGMTGVPIVDAAMRQANTQGIFRLMLFACGGANLRML